MKNRNQIAALAAVILGLVFLYQPRYILLKGIALLLLTLAAILSATSFSKNRIVEGIAAIGFGAGFIFLYLPVSKDTPILSTLHGSAFHLLFASAIAFGMTTRLKKAAAIVAAIIAIVGLVFLYQPYVFLFTLDMPEEFYSLRQLEDAIRNEGHQLKERLFQFSPPSQGFRSSFDAGRHDCGGDCFAAEGVNRTHVARRDYTRVGLSLSTVLAPTLPNRFPNSTGRVNGIHRRLAPVGLANKRTDFNGIENEHITLVTRAVRKSDCFKSLSFDSRNLDSDEMNKKRRRNYRGALQYR